MMQSPEERIRLIENSLRCFAYGLWSLVPLVGLGLAVLAIRLHSKTWTDAGEGWNPARRYLLAGFCLAWLGALITVGVLAGFVMLLINHSEH